MKSADPFPTVTTPESGASQGKNTMDKMNDGAGPEMPAQDRALAALADLLEYLGGEAAYAFVGGGPTGDALLSACQDRAATVARAIVALPAVTLHGASAKARAARASVAVALLPTELVDALGFDMARDVARLRGIAEVGHA